MLYRLGRLPDVICGARRITGPNYVHGDRVLTREIRREGPNLLVTGVEDKPTSAGFRINHVELFDLRDGDVGFKLSRHGPNDHGYFDLIDVRHPSDEFLFLKFNVAGQDIRPSQDLLAILQSFTDDAVPAGPDEADRNAVVIARQLSAILRQVPK